jgi:hypothetical protein
MDHNDGLRSNLKRAADPTDTAHKAWDNLTNRMENGQLHKKVDKMYSPIADAMTSSMDQRLKLGHIGRPGSKARRPIDRPGAAERRQQEHIRMLEHGERTIKNGATTEGSKSQHADAGGSTGRVREHQRMTANGKVSTVHEHAARRLHA